MFIVGCTSNQAQTPSELIVHNTPTQKPTYYDVLANATIFGFGVRRGEKPTARKTDTAFKVLLSQPNAKKRFVSLFNQGNTYSKLYSLCALHHLDKKLFQKLSAEINKNKIVRTINGCVVDESTVGKIINEIKNGRYDYIIKEIKQKNAEQNRIR